MLILNNTLDAIEVVLASPQVTNPCQIVASYRDVGADSFLPGATAVNTNGTTTLDAVTGPSVGLVRVIDFLSLYNNDTVTHTVTFKYDVNNVEFRLITVSIGVGERLQYSDGAGFVVYNAAGAIKTILTGTANPVGTGWSTNVLAADVTNNNGVANTMQDVTGLSFPVVAGQRYNFKFVINYTAAATTTGSRWAINGPAFTELRYDSEYSLTTTTKTINTGQASYDLPAASNASSAATGSNIAIIEGYIMPSADGIVIARFASEVLSSAIVAKRGSYATFLSV